MTRAFFVRTHQAFTPEGLYGFGGLSGLSPNWRKDTRPATQRAEFFVVNNKKIVGRWRCPMLSRQFGDNPLNPPNPYKPSGVSACCCATPVSQPDLPCCSLRSYAVIR